ncbi:uncharacterized protein G2W53_038464 [Senna tora]|uniref:Uncharacterized protein n=1 Tax=Senna tora TaxID=362788 RepID=A0A834SL51_9FABA|nr:uncharacterized protein G2W53_038464 [Senna tora]
MIDEIKVIYIIVVVGRNLIRSEKSGIVEVHVIKLMSTEGKEKMTPGIKEAKRNGFRKT